MICTLGPLRIVDPHKHPSSADWVTHQSHGWAAKALQWKTRWAKKALRGRIFLEQKKFSRVCRGATLYHSNAGEKLSIWTMRDGHDFLRNVQPTASLSLSLFLSFDLSIIARERRAFVATFFCPVSARTLVRRRIDFNGINLHFFLFVYIRRFFLLAFLVRKRRC